MLNALILSAFLFCDRSNPFVASDCPLPWQFPSWPAVPEATTEPPALATPEHGATYEADLADTQDQVDGWTEPVTNLTTNANVWLGASGALPDTSTDQSDFDTGLAPLQDYGSAQDFASEMGTNIASLWEYARAISTFDHSGFGLLITEILACGVLLLLVRMIIFGIQIADALWTFGTQLADTIANYFVPW